jgi:hypothetical protein
MTGTELKDLVNLDREEGKRGRGEEEKRRRGKRGRGEEGKRRRGEEGKRRGKQKK